MNVNEAPHDSRIAKALPTTNTENRLVRIQ
jgi:hypothetical protein